MTVEPFIVSLAAAEAILVGLLVVVLWFAVRAERS